MESTAVVRFSNLFEVDSTDLDLKMAPDFPIVVETNAKRNAEDIRKSASRPRLNKSLILLIIV